MDYRTEKDSLGEINVPKDKYWAAQTQRSFENFKIGTEKMPMEIIRAFAIIKKAAALTNYELKLIDKNICDAICLACDEILNGKLNDNFPLVVWQTGSGTQSNMNVNEVITNRANEILHNKHILNSQNASHEDFHNANNSQNTSHDNSQNSDNEQNTEKYKINNNLNLNEIEKIIHPNDHVNKSQSSNDTFPTAMHISAITEIENKLLPSLQQLKNTFYNLSNRYMDIIKTGRTHLQDATPITLGQEISAWHRMLEKSENSITNNLDSIREIALGGTAVGTGLNTHKDFANIVANHISDITGKNFISAQNKFHALTSLDGICTLHGCIKSLAVDLLKIANDIRWLASGPRCGIGEISIPANEPGSSIMPGKVNPTQCEALSMVVAQIIGNDVTIGFAASQGNFQLNVYLPVTIYNFIQSTNLLSDAMCSFNNNCAMGIKPNLDKIKQNLDKSLMLVTALNNHIGYDNAAKIAKIAHENNITLKRAAIKSGLINEDDFNKFVNPKDMVSQ